MKVNKMYKSNILLIIASVLTVVTVVLVFIARFKDNTILAIIGSVLCLIEMFVLSFSILFVFKDMAKTMIDDYKSKNNLFSGAMCIILIAITLFLLFKGFGNMIYNDENNDLNGMANTIITLTPALLSLLGVHYSNMIQETRRKEDFKVANTPCPLVECCVERIHDENNIQNIYMNVKIKNLADNILIPLYIAGKKLNYSPVTKDIDRTFENIRVPYRNYNNVFFIYEDSSGNTYKTKLDIKIDERFQARYTTTKNDEPVLLMPEELLMLSEQSYR